MEKVSILIPVYNSEKTIVDLCKCLMEMFSGYQDFQVVLVNDGSHDNSGKLCRQLCDDYPEILTYVELARNFGEHNALMAGLNHVAGDYCVIMDDDFQNPPEAVKKLTDEIRKGYDVVYTYYEERNYPLFRRLGSYFNDRVANIVLKKPRGLYLSSFKCINRFLVNELIKYDGQDPYLDGIILRSTDRIGKVCVEQHARRAGKSGYTIRKLLSLWTSMLLNFSLIPLRVIGILGVLLSLCSVAYSIHQRFFDPPFDPLTDTELIVVLLLFLIGLVFLGIALLAEYIGRMYLFMNKQPQYVVRETVTRRKLTS